MLLAPFAWDGFDIFGAGTLDRPWHPNQAAVGTDPLDAAKAKMAAAFEFFDKLGAPFFSFHDADIAPAGATFADTCRNVDEMVDVAAGHMERTGTKLLWGTANLFSHPRFMAGAATNPDPDLFVYAGRAGGALHGCNEDVERRELRAVGRPRGLRDAAEHRHEAASWISSAGS